MRGSVFSTTARNRREVTSGGRKTIAAKSPERSATRQKTFQTCWERSSESESALWARDPADPHDLRIPLSLGSFPDSCLLLIRGDLMKTFILFLTLVAAGHLLVGAEPKRSNPPTDSLTLERLAALVPADVNIKRGSKINPVGIALANAALKQAIGQEATLDIAVEKLTPTGSTKAPIVIKSRTNQVAMARTKVPCAVFTYVRAEDLPVLANAKKGTALTVSGRVVKAELTNEPGLIIDLMDSGV